MMEPTDKTFKSFLLSFAGVLAGGLFAVATVNALVDPEGRTDLVNAAGFNSVKTALEPTSRTAKALALAQCDYDQIILGTSSADMGIYPGSTAFANRPTFNASAHGAHYSELAAITDYIAQHQNPESVVFGIDFVSFLDEAQSAFDFPNSRYAGPPDALLMAQYFLSRFTLVDSIETVITNLRSPSRVCAHNGMNDRRGMHVPHRQAFDKLLSVYVGRYSHAYVPAITQAFGEMLKLLADDGIRTYVYISPTHALQIEVLREMGRLDEFNQWKRDIAVTVEQLNSSLPPEVQVSVRDYSGYNTITMETVPADNETQMQWFRDPTHFRTVTGELILNQMLDSTIADNDRPDDFGRLLSSASVETVIKESLARRDEYAAANPNEIQRTKGIVAETRQKLARNAEPQTTDLTFMGK